MNKYLLSLLLLLPITFVVAQDVEEENEDDVEEVVVLGIKQSLKDAIDIKRSNVGIVDAITAEDFGQFPDGNLAESLARVVGVAIDRSNVEGQKVAVRGFGPEFNLVTLNGRQMPTIPGQWDGGRSFNFGDISSHGVSAVEIYKSTNLTLPTGGIGSTINMVTTKPLDVEGKMTSMSLAGVNDTTRANGIKNPLEFDFVTSTNNGSWGWAMSGSYQTRANREEGTQESNWQTTLPMVNTVTIDDAGNPYQEARKRLENATITGSTKRADGAIFVPERHGYQIKDNNRVRKNFQATLQKEFGDSVEATLDYTHSEVKFATTGTRWGQWLAGWNSTAATVQDNGAVTNITTASSDFGHEASWGNSRNHNNSLGLNVSWDVTDNLNLQLDIHQSTAELTGPSLDNIMTFSTGQTSTITNDLLNGGGINTYSYSRNYSASEFAADAATIQDRDSLNDMEQIRVFGEWINSNGLISESLRSVEFGFSRVDQAFTDIRKEQKYDISADTGPEDIDDSIFTPTTLENFMNGFNGLNLTDSDIYFAINHNAAIAAYTGLAGNLTAGDIDSNSRVTEVLDSFYVQFNFESSFRDRPLNTVFALRYEEAKNSSVGLSPLPSQIIWDYPGISYGTDGVVTIQNNQHDGMETTAAGSALLTDVSDATTQDILLPALSMSWAMSEDEVVRFGLSQSIARPALRDLSSVYELGVKERILPTAHVGNPQLEPLKSTNIDIAYENYYAEGSYFAVNVFHKELEDFISTSTSLETINGITNPMASENAQAAIELVDYFFSIVAQREAACGAVGNAFDLDENCKGWWDAGFTGNSPFGMSAQFNPTMFPLGVPYPIVTSIDPFFAGKEVLYAYMTWWANLGPHTYQPWDGGQTYNYTVPPYTGVYTGPWAFSWEPPAVPNNQFPLIGSATDPLALFEVTKPINLKEGGVDGIEIALQHLFDNGFGVQFNATKVVGGDVEPDLNNLYQQDALPGLGDSGNFSVFYENESFSGRLAFNHRGETYVGEGNYYQPLYVEARTHVDIALSYRVDDKLGFFFDAMNITDEPTRLFARHSEMLFLSQDHGPVYKAGFIYKF